MCSTIQPAQPAGTAVGSATNIEARTPMHRLGLLLATLCSWSGRSGLAILDQALFAGSNFLISVMLARWLPLDIYGAFALVYSIFLLFGTFHTAVLTEPMMVFGPGKYAGCVEQYLRMLYAGHFVITVPVGLILAAIALPLGRVYPGPSQPALLGLAIASPMMLLLWLVRRAFYVRLRPGWAALGGTVYLASIAVSTFALYTTGHLSALTAFAAMGAGSLLAAIVQTPLLLLPSRCPHPVPLPAKQVAADHWQYGRWSVAAAGLSWVPVNVYYLWLPVSISLGAAAGFKALMNLVMPVLHAIAALSMLLLPVLARKVTTGDGGQINKTVQTVGLLLILGSTAYLLLLWSFRSAVFRVLYAGKYEEYAGLPLLLVGILPLVSSLAAVLGCAIRAMERPQWLFWSYLLSALVALAVGLPLAERCGVSGALTGLLLSYIASVGPMFWFYRKAVHLHATP